MEASVQAASFTFNIASASSIVTFFTGQGFGLCTTNSLLVVEVANVLEAFLADDSLESTFESTSETQSLANATNKSKLESAINKYSSMYCKRHQRRNTRSRRNLVRLLTL